MDRENDLSKKTPAAAIKDIWSATTLVELDGLLTASMAQQQIQALIKEERLDSILKKVTELAQTEAETENAGLLVLALLGRLSAVARGRESVISKTLPMLVRAGSLPPLESSTLDGDGKFYAAQSLSQMGSSTWAPYAFEESVNVDTAEKARKSLIEIALNSCPTVAEALETHCSALENLASISNAESRLRKARRISSGWAEVLRGRSHDLGERPGEALAKWIAALLAGDIRDVDETLLFNIVDDGIDILLRFIELRFSHAMLTETYQMLSRAKVILGRARWIHFLPFSKTRQALTLCLRESALVLARQGKTDSTLLDLIQLMYQSKAQMLNDMERHFGKAMELDPDVRQWWLAGGAVSNSRQTIHKVGNNEDQMIGELLIEVQSAEPFMRFLRHTIVPMVDISDSVMATNGIKAAAGYSEIARKVALLARMRKLSTTDMKGMVVEFNPLQHELLSDSTHGIREVKVTRDGVLKDFGGNIKTLVKPRVEPLS
ncbi:hypothetical protein [Pseudomonas coronafaciens]|uniref:hypothetical protein n=1 Tax=Pseudomonas coronafaciens TaxID=53409 RepID=UPI000F00DD1E|nr:hypothetical protein [Pseudomonas coronafaciens]RMP23993.1 hypothetical protein ALQ25_00120 [Pseudomonas coronafaciens pv. atropurpurea]